ncbi:hypothetical protein [Larkinella rosea]|uniref:Uncharacterized protein n=1 Tax=Larkinella rosea TaxID=2025312 RepID=A0A3P1BMH7_9BACT|nr:hypothetical protein [Larkinella rosea]RRB02238.1 hypothetical protein EHT25_17295 [Larkinella rosea]
MKNNTYYRLTLLAVILSLSVTAATFGQGRQNRLTNSPREGYWVIESQPRQKSVALFYNDDNQLIYKEVLSKKRLNIKQAKTQESLKAVLEQALRQWAVSQKTGGNPIQNDQQWLAAELN